MKQLNNCSTKSFWFASPRQRFPDATFIWFWRSFQPVLFQLLRNCFEPVLLRSQTKGLQLLGKIRWHENDPKNQDLLSIQLIQNKLTRLLNNVTVKDKISTATLLNNIGGLSVNQLKAQIKITELWKIVNLENYSKCFSKILEHVSSDITRESRSRYNMNLPEVFGSSKIKTTFINDGIKA